MLQCSLCIVMICCSYFESFQLMLRYATYNIRIHEDLPQMLKLTSRNKMCFHLNFCCANSVLAFFSHFANDPVVENFVCYIFYNISNVCIFLLYWTNNFNILITIIYIYLNIVYTFKQHKVYMV